MTDKEWSQIERLYPGSILVPPIGDILARRSPDGSYSLSLEGSRSMLWLVVWQLDDGSWEVGDPHDPGFQAPYPFPSRRSALSWGFSYLRAADATARLTTENAS